MPRNEDFKGVKTHTTSDQMIIPTRIRSGIAVNDHTKERCAVILFIDDEACANPAPILLSKASLIEFIRDLQMQLAAI